MVARTQSARFRFCVFIVYFSFVARACTRTQLILSACLKGYSVHRSSAVRNVSTEYCGAQTQRRKKRARTLLSWRNNQFGLMRAEWNRRATPRNIAEKVVQQLTADRGVLSFFDTSNSYKCALSTFPSYSLTFMRCISSARLVLSVAFVKLFYCITSFLLPSSACTRPLVCANVSSVRSPQRTQSNGMKIIQRLFV